MKNRFSSFSGKKVLVTGATGFIGPHLCEKLVDVGAEVIAVSRKSSLKSIGISYYQVDLTKSDETKLLFNEVFPDYVFHLAGLTVGNREGSLIKTTLESNLLTTINVLAAVNEQKKPRLVLLGSMEEPSDNEINAVPSSPYAASKWAASSYARMYHSLYNTNLVIARLFMTYGPGTQPKKKLLPYVVNSLLDGKSPNLSSGKRLIDWIYIDDVIEGFLSIAAAEAIRGNTIDIGSGNLVSIKEFVIAINNIIGNNVEISFGQEKDRKMEQQKKANTAFTFEKIAWRPKVSLEDGLQKTIHWYRQQKELTKN